MFFVFILAEFFDLLSVTGIKIMFCYFIEFYQLTLLINTKKRKKRREKEGILYLVF